MDFSTLLGYFTGLYLIKSDITWTTLVRTTLVVHTIDAVLCGLVAANSNRSKNIWTLAGLVFGIWALGLLFVLPAVKQKN